MVNGIGSIGRQVRFGNQITSADLAQRITPGIVSSEQPAAAAPIGAQPAEAEVPKKSRKGLYITLGTIAVAVGLIAAGKKGLLGDKAKEWASKVADPVIKRSKSTYETVTTKLGEWKDKIFNKGKKEAPAPTIEAPPAPAPEAPAA